MQEVRTTWIPDASRPNGWLVYVVLDCRRQRCPSPRPRRRLRRARKKSLLEVEEMGLCKSQPAVCSVRLTFQMTSYLVESALTERLKIWQPQHQSKERFSGDGRVLQIISREFRS